MRLSRPIQLLVGAATLLPIVYMVYFFVAMSSSIATRHGGPDDFDLLFRLHLGTMLLIFALLIFYIVYLFRTTRVSQDKKALWAVVLFMGNMFAMPVFWFLYVWRDPTPEAKSVDL